MSFFFIFNFWASLSSAGHTLSQQSLQEECAILLGRSSTVVTFAKKLLTQEGLESSDASPDFLSDDELADLWIILDDGTPRSVQDFKSRVRAAWRHYRRECPEQNNNTLLMNLIEEHFKIVKKERH